jgi:DNA-binding GntR family transcriptional regulator
MHGVAAPQALRSARSVNSSQLAVELIREAILDGQLAAGERLKEDELARRLDVSRTPVREALRRLESEGLVVVEPQRGATVRAYEGGELDDMYRLRAVLEGYAARRAAERISDDALAGLRKSCDRFSRLAARKRVTPRELARENQLFHDGILAAAEDRRLAEMARSVIHLPLVYKAYVWYTPHQRRQSAHYHEQLVAAIARHDAERAGLIMQEHVYEARDSLVAALAAES